MPLLSSLLILTALFLLVVLTRLSYSRAIAVLVFLIPAYLLRLELLIPTNVFELATGVVFLTALSQTSSRASLLRAIKSLKVSFKITLLIFLGAVVLSTFISPHLNTSLGVLKGWIIIPLLFAWLALSALKHQEHGKLSATKSPSSPWSFIHTLLALGSLLSLHAVVTSDLPTRAQGIYDVPNSLALFLAPLLSAALYLLFTRPAYRFWYAASATILLIGVLASQSVSGLIAVVLTLALTAFLPDLKRHRRFALASVVLIIIISSALLHSTGRLAYLISPITQPQATNSITVRTQLWSISRDMILTSPLNGVGLGIFEPAYQNQLHQRFEAHENCLKAGQSCSAPLPEFVFRDPHNWLLSFWLNTGLAGLLSFITLNMIALSSVFRNRSQVKDPSRVAFAFALITLLLFGLSDTIFWKNDLSAVHFLTLFLLADATAPKKD